MYTESSSKPASQTRPQARPWIRFWARNLDQFLFILFSIPLVGFFLKVAPKEEGIGLWVLSFMPLFSLYEALCFSLFGTTPAKWLLGVRVTTLEGRPLTFTSAFYRSLAVWLKGYALLVPIASYIANAFSYYQLTRQGVTSWDRGRFRVSHEPISWPKAAFCWLLVLLSFLYFGYWSADQQLQKRQVQSADKQWEMALLPGWEGIELSASQGIMGAENKQNKSYLRVLCVPFHVEDKELLKAKILDVLAGEFSEFELSGPHELKAGHWQATQVELIGPGPGGERLGLFASVVDTSAAFIVLCFWSPEENFQAQLVSFRAMADTLASTSTSSDQRSFF